MDIRSIEKHNVETFEKYGTDNSGEYRHICTVCGEKTCIDGSVSRQGYYLMCNVCFQKKCWEEPDFSTRYFRGDYEWKPER